MRTWWRSSSQRSGRHKALRGFQPVHAEEAVRIAPHSARHETRRSRKGAEILHSVFVGPFGVDRFAFGKGNLTAADRDALSDAAHQIDLDAPKQRVVECIM